MSTTGAAEPTEEEFAAFEAEAAQAYRDMVGFDLPPWDAPVPYQNYPVGPGCASCDDYGVLDGLDPCPDCGPQTARDGCLIVTTANPWGLTA